MGELISVIFARVVLAFENSFFGINMHYFVIHAPISPITLGFGFLWVLIADFHLKSEVLGEKNEVEAKWIQES